jgi:glutathione synthase/RimK-type ligase-like ATP-grasp enzyme
MRIAILIPRADYSADWRWAYDLESEALLAAGAEVSPLRWDDPFDPAEFDLVLPLVAWGYHQHFDRWLGLLDRLEPHGGAIQNPVPLLRWNSNKAYLAELCETSVPTVPTKVVERLDEAALARAREHFQSADLVVKPPVSASAYRTFKLGPGDSVPDSVRGRRMMVQPWLPAILDSGEWSLIFFDGRLSHAVSKLPAAGEFRVQPEHGGIIALCDPPAGAEQIALAALAAAPAPALYARVDLVIGNCGALQVMELELIEPAFFLAQAPGSEALFAEAVLSAAKRSGEQPLADR